MSLNQLQVNARIELEVNDSEHEGKYFSRVMDFTSKEIKIMAPTAQGEVLRLPVKSRVNITFVGERALYTFDTIIIGRFNKPIPGFSVKVPSRVQRIQRREFVRLEVKVECNYRVVNEMNLLGEQPNSFKDGYIVDISGGGVKYHCEEKVEVGSFVDLMLGIDPIQAEVLSGKVVRSVQRVEGGYEIGVAFLELPSSVQDQIISWIFDKQRDLRRKGFA